MNTPQPGLCFVCQLCGRTILEPCDAPEVELRRRIEANTLHTFHSCGIGMGVARLIGVANTYATAEAQLAAMKGTEA